MMKLSFMLLSPLCCLGCVTKKHQKSILIFIKEEGEMSPFVTPVMECFSV